MIRCTIDWKFFNSHHVRLPDERPPAISFSGAQRAFYFGQRHGGSGIFFVCGKAGFNQSFVGIAQWRIFQFQCTMHKLLPLLDGESGQLFENLAETHVGKVMYKIARFNEDSTRPWQFDWKAAGGLPQSKTLARW
jgi:hypothetical protein